MRTLGRLVGWVWAGLKPAPTLLLLVAGVWADAGHAQASPVPRAALPFQRTLTREARSVWGIDAPVASFAAQIHQESHWNPRARSAVGALGLTQFMPATATWIAPMVGTGGAQSLNPTWAMRALVVYDQWLYERVEARNPCERLAFALQAYNGGLGWVHKRQARATRVGMDRGVCLPSVAGVGACALNPGVTAASQDEAEQYPARILRMIEPIYLGWGRGSCAS